MHPLRPIRAEEFETWARTIAFTYGEERRDCELALERAAIELDRTLAAFDADRIVGGAAIFSRVMAVPGAALPIARVSWVGVSPTHRRRGILTAMMRRQLTELHETGGEAVAALNAADGGIYGRFGYGMGTREARFEGDTRAMGFRPGVPTGGQVLLLPRAEARPLIEAVYAEVWPTRIGWRARTPVWWEDLLHDDDHMRGSATALRFAVHHTEDKPTGYALFRLGGGAIHVLELAASTPTAYATLWRFLIDIDGHPTLHATGSPDEPLPHLLANPRSLHTTTTDDIWVRLVDIDRALSARRYATPLDVILEVEDTFCPWNTGRYHLTADPTGATCERTPSTPALRLTAADLAATYMGDTTFAVLAATGRVEEMRPGAIATCTNAFRAPAG
ncbi:GNAT family N-acetyltransferase [Actinokineospora sp. NPDC004072]